jgi:hypothetical protein
MLEVILFVAIYLFVVFPICTLIHEIAHAILALRYSTGRVVVWSGRPPAFIEMVGDRVRVYWSPLPMRNVGKGGLCSWNAGEATDLERVAVSLAGPLTDALFVSLLIWATFTTGADHSFVSRLILVTTYLSLARLFANLNPRSRVERDGVMVPWSDGATALAAYRRWRGP